MLLQDFCSFLNWVKSGNALPKDFTFEETGGTGILCILEERKKDNQSDGQTNRDK